MRWAQGRNTETFTPFRITAVGGRAVGAVPRTGVSLVENGEAAGDFVVDVFGEDLLFAEFVGILIGAVGDDGAGHGGGDAGERFEVGSVGGIDVDADFGWFAGEAVADAEDGGLCARGDGSGGIGGVFADALLAAGAGGAAEGKQEGWRGESVPGSHG